MTSGASIDIEAAERRIRPHILRTPLVEWSDQRLWLKCENEQLTGSFKLRGALNKILGSPERELKRGIVAASAGNHGIGVALACQLAGSHATVVVPRDVVERKRRMLERLGAEVVLAGGDYGVAEREGRALAAAKGALFVSPYNDPDVVAGQGTLGLELAGQLATIRRTGGPVEVFVPVSGGGLLAGVGLGLRLAGAVVRLIGVQTEAAPYFHRFFHGGDPSSVLETPTIADGLAGAVEAGSITYELVRQVADDIVLVGENEIASAILEVARATGMVVEPSAAVAVAGSRLGEADCRIAVLSGGNAAGGLLDRLGTG